MRDPGPRLWASRSFHFPSKSCNIPGIPGWPGAPWNLFVPISECPSQSGLVYRGIARPRGKRADSGHLLCVIVCFQTVFLSWLPTDDLTEDSLGLNLSSPLRCWACRHMPPPSPVYIELEGWNSEFHGYWANALPSELWPLSLSAPCAFSQKRVSDPHKLQYRWLWVLSTKLKFPQGAASTFNCRASLACQCLSNWWTTSSSSGQRAPSASLSVLDPM